MSKNTISASDPGLPSNRDILEAYREWLENEASFLGRELYPELGGEAYRSVPIGTLARHFHFPVSDAASEPSQPSTRAKMVLRAVGVLPDDPPATVEQCAAIDFEPWTHEEGEAIPPTNSEWNAMNQTHLVALRMAWYAIFGARNNLQRGFLSLARMLATR